MFSTPGKVLGAVEANELRQRVNCSESLIAGRHATGADGFEVGEKHAHNFGRHIFDQEPLQRLLVMRVNELEEQHRLNFLTAPDAGFAAATFRWASGMSLDAVLDEDLTAGDFVRWTRQLIDLLDQIAAASEDEVARTARQAVSSLRRGVVAQAPARATAALAGVPPSAD